MAAASSVSAAVLSALSLSFIECTICFERFDDKQRCPIALGCCHWHTFCNECVEKMKKPLHDSSAAAASSSSSSSSPSLSSPPPSPKYMITCPRCNVTSSETRKNYSIIEILHELNNLNNNIISNNNNNNNNQSENSGSSESKAAPCGRCDASATIYCEQCNNDFCEKCAALWHKGSGKLSAHDLHPMNEKEIHAIPRCDKHPHERVMYYCHHDDCKKMVCHLCTIAESHCKTHPTQSIEDVKDKLVNKARQQLSSIAPVIRSHADNLFHGEEMNGAVRNWGARMIRLVNETVDAFQSDYKQFVGESESVRKSYSISAAKGESYLLEAERLLNTILPKDGKPSKYETTAAVRRLQLVLQNVNTAEQIESEELKSFKDRFLSIPFSLNRTQESRNELSKEIGALGDILKPIVPMIPIDSLIVNEKTILCRLFDMNHWKINFVLLYRGSRDGFTAAAFHSKCNNKGATLTIIRTTNDEIIGGYSSIEWIECTGKARYDFKEGTVWIYAITNYPSNKNSGKNEEGVSGDVGIVKLLPSVTGQTDYGLITHRSVYGPIFGYTSITGTHDLMVYDNMTAANTNFYRRGLFTIGGSMPFFPSSTNYNYFTVKEIEVFHVDIQS